MNSKDNPNRRQYQIDMGYSKECSICGEEKSVEDYYWQKSHNAPSSSCKECWKANNKRRWKTDKDYKTRHKEYVGKWLDKGGREYINAYRRKRYAEEPELRAKYAFWNSRYKNKKKDKE